MPVWKIEESIEADYQASLKTAQNPDGGPCPAFANDKSWDETSGKTGSGKKFCHSVISRTDSAAQPSYVAIVTSVKTLHSGLEIDEIQQAWVGIQSQFQAPYAAKEVVGSAHGDNRLGGNSLLDCVVFGRVTGVACGKYVLGDEGEAISRGTCRWSER